MFTRGKEQAAVAQTLDSAIHRINHYPADSFIDFRNAYLLDSDLSRGQRYPTFEQPGPERQFFLKQVSGKNMQATTAANFTAKTEHPVHTVMLF